MTQKQTLTFCRVADMGIGNELDILVAELVMGIRVLGNALCFNYDGAWQVDDPSEFGPDSGGVLRPVYQDGQDEWQDDQSSCIRRVFGVCTFALKPLPRYGESIHDAWLVFEKMREYFCHASVDYDNGYHCRCHNVAADGSKENYVHAQADSPMLAICRAALFASIHGIINPEGSPHVKNT